MSHFSTGSRANPVAAPSIYCRCRTPLVARCTREETPQQIWNAQDQSAGKQVLNNSLTQYLGSWLLFGSCYQPPAAGPRRKCTTHWQPYSASPLVHFCIPFLPQLFLFTNGFILAKRLRYEPRYTVRFLPLHHFTIDVKPIFGIQYPGPQRIGKHGRIVLVIKPKEFRGTPQPNVFQPGESRSFQYVALFLAQSIPQF